jgi:hypothetical protein
MSKKNLKNISGIGARITKVLTDNNLVKRNGTVNFSEAERKCKMKGTVLQKAVKRDGGLYDENLDKFLRTFHVKREWLLHGKGDEYDKNITNVEIRSQSNAEEIIQLYKDLAKTKEERIQDLILKIAGLEKDLAECKSSRK